METAVYVRFKIVNDLFNRLSVWPSWKAAAVSEDAKLPGARLAEDVPARLAPVIAERTFGQFRRWIEVTPETETVVATD